MNAPTVGIVIPTLNADRVIEGCLRSLAGQEYPRECLEIVIVDGGSRDRTLALADSFRRQGLPLRIVPNPLKTGEAGKFVGLQATSADLVAFIDSDNILPDPGWLKAMVQPFQEDGSIIATEPLAYTYRREDGYINRYCALLGMNDPLCLFIGNYDRLCLVTNRWTGLAVAAEDRGNYLRVRLGDGPIPTVGANGFLIRRKILHALCPGPYLFDVDVLQEAVKQRGHIMMAKVKTGIVHLYCSGYGAFIRKQKRRVRDYLHHRGRERVSDPWTFSRLRGVILFALSSLCVVPLAVQSCVGMGRRPDVCWLFHAPACLTTLVIYAYYCLRGITGDRPDLSRDNWSQ